MTQVPRHIFVTGTDTGIGKTLVSGVLATAWRADYWKPVQSGLDDETDSQALAHWIGSDRVFPERFRLNRPLSPNQSAHYDGVSLKLEDFTLPATDRPLVVEGAGGLMVPLNDEHMMIDLVAHLGLPVVLVARSSLGTLNHTLLSIEALRRRQIPILAVVFSGEPHPDNQRDIQHFGGVPIAGVIPPLPDPKTADLRRVYEDYLSF